MLVDLVCELERPILLPLPGKGVSRIFELVGRRSGAYADRLLLRTGAGAGVAELLDGGLAAVLGLRLHTVAHRASVTLVGLTSQLGVDFVRQNKEARDKLHTLLEFVL